MRSEEWRSWMDRGYSTRQVDYIVSMEHVHGHQEETIPAGEFKQRCLALLDRVAETGMPIVVTKRGRPVARVVPIDSPSRSMRGNLRVLSADEEELFSTGETWEAQAPE